MLKKLLLGAVFAGIAGFAAAQTSPNFVTGQIPTAAQWNSYFAGKTDYYPSGIPVSAGGTGATSAGTTAAHNIGALSITANLSDLNSISTARANLGLGTAATQNSTVFLQVSNNLSDLGSVSTARGNLGLGTAAIVNTTSLLQVSNNLSDLGSVSTALTNLGLAPVGTSGAKIPLLSTANTWSTTQFFAASTSAAAGVNFAPGAVPSAPNNGDFWITSSGAFARINGTTQQLASVSGAVTSFNTRTGAVTLQGTDVTSALAYTPLNPANNLSDLNSASTARTNLGLGSAATQASSVFLQVTNNLSDVGSTSSARSNLGLGTSATVNTGTSGATIPLLNTANTWGAEQNFIASASGSAGVNFAPGTAPSSPNNGDFWITSSGVYAQVGGSTQQLASTSGAVTSFNTRTGAVTLTSGDVTTALTYTPLKPSNNLSDVSSASTSRTNLGLGTAATQNTGTSGANVPLLNGTNIWSSEQFFTASTSANAGANFAPGVAPSAPSNGDFWITGTGVFARVNGSTQQLASTGGAVTSFNTRTGAVTLISSDVTNALTYTPLNPANNLSDVVNPSTSRANLGIGSAGTQSASFFLQSANNLSDLANVSSARGNLGLGTAATQNTGTTGSTIPLLNGNNVWSGTQQFTGLLTSGTITGAACFDSSGHFINNSSANCFAGGGGSAGTLADIAALRALTSASTTSYVVQQFCGTGSYPAGICAEYTNGLGGGTFVYNANDTTSNDNGCTIFKDSASPTPHRWYRVYSGSVNVQWCGAQGDGSNDDTTAIQNAVLVGNVYVPGTANYYPVNGTITLAIQGQQFIGDGPFSTTIKETSATTTTPLIKISTTPTSLSGVSIQNMLLDRTNTATAGGNGIDSSAGDTEQALIQNVYVQHQWNGMALGITNNSTVINAVNVNNYNNGISMVATASGGVLQWSLLEVTDNTNGTSTAPQGDGIYVATISGQNVSLGTWTQLNDFANYNHGVDVEGISAAYAVNGVRIEGGFFGQDGYDGIYINSYGYLHDIRPTQVELSGRGQVYPSGCNALPGCVGVGLNYTASDTGAGINITPNNRDANIALQRSNGNAFDGILIAANQGTSSITVAGGIFSNNGAGANAVSLGRANGLYIYNVGGSVSITGISSFGNYIGISSNSDVLAVSGSNFGGNTSASYAFSWLSQTKSCLAGNRPIDINACP